jgi:hypothetical protein
MESNPTLGTCKKCTSRRYCKVYRTFKAAHFGAAYGAGKRSLFDIINRASFNEWAKNKPEPEVRMYGGGTLRDFLHGNKQIKDITNEAIIETIKPKEITDGKSNKKEM